MAFGRKTGGRQAGTPNRASVAKAAEIAASGLTPLDYLLEVMRDTSLEVRSRLGAAIAAAPYVHPKLASVQHSGLGAGPLTPTIIYNGPNDAGWDFSKLSDEQLESFRGILETMTGEKVPLARPRSTFWERIDGRPSDASSAEG